jgi:hypothetical protein
MVPDIRFEADVLRTVLALGIVPPADVVSWADALLVTEPDQSGLLAGVALTVPELSAQREALRPLAEPTDEGRLGAAILTFLARDSALATRSVPDQVRLLSHLRREIRLPAGIAEAIKLFEDRLMLATAGIDTEPMPSLAEISAWFDRASAPAYYRLTMARDDEQAAFLGAISRKLVRTRSFGRVGDRSKARGWLYRAPVSGAVSIFLNGALWQIAAAEFSPLPVGSRIPYADLPAHATLILDEDNAEPMGVADAANRLAAV